MKKRKIMRTLLAALLVVSLTASLSAGALDSWFQAPSDWAAEDMERAQAEGLLQPQLCGQDLQAPITRREFAVLAVQLADSLGLDVSGKDTSACPFTDTDSDPYVAQAWALGLVNGVSDTQFAPDRAITRMEICVLLDRAMDACGVALPQTVDGVAQRLDSGAEGEVPQWARQSVIDIVGAGLMQGTGSSLDLYTQTPREQAMVLGLRCLDLGRGVQSAFTPEEQAKIAQLKALKATFGDPGETYAQAPSLTAPFSLGKVNDAFLQDGLNAINYVRAVAGLEPVTMSAEKNEAAQYGAVLLAASGQFGHYPTQSEGIPDDLYQKGAAATKTSNLGYGHANLSRFTLSCMDDSDQSNIAAVGHRRWLLDPNLTSVGLGYAGTISVTQVTNGIVQPWAGPDHITWPSEGVFPAELVDSNLAWSCSLDPDRYTGTNWEGLTVTVTDSAGNRWSKQAVSRTDITGSFVLLSGTFYGDAPAVIFRPEGLNLQPGRQLTVEISGLATKGEGTASISYTVKLF